MSEEKYFGLGDSVLYAPHGVNDLIDGRAVTKEELRNILLASSNWLASEFGDSFVSTWTRIDLWPDCAKITFEHYKINEFLVSYDRLRVYKEWLCAFLYEGIEVRVNL